MKEVKKPLYKKWWIWLIAFFAVLVIYGAATGINQAKNDLDKNETEVDAAEKEDPQEVEEDPEQEIEYKESDPEVVKEYVKAFDDFQEELEQEYAARIETNNIDNWGPFFKDYSDRVNASREELQESELNGEDKFQLGAAHTSLVMLAIEYGKAISGEEDEALLKNFKEEAAEHRSNYE